MTRLAIAVLAALGSVGAARAAPPPASAFGRIPAVIDAVISPNGQRIAILGSDGNQRRVSIATIDQPGLPTVQLGEVKGYSVDWAGDAYVITTVEYRQSMGDGRTYDFQRQIAITPDAKVASRLLDLGITAGNRFVFSMPLVRIVGEAAAPRAMMIGLVESGGANAANDTRIKRKGEGGAVRALFRVDPATGRGEIVERGSYDTVHWNVDDQGEPRVRTDLDEVRHTISLFGRAKGSQRWSAIFTDLPRDTAPNYLGYSEPDDAVILSKEGETVLHRLSDGSEAPFDLRPGEGLVWDGASSRVLGMRSEVDRVVYRWTDPEMNAAHGVASRAFRNQRVSMWSWSADRSRVILRVGGPTASPAWYLFDRTKKQISVLSEEYPELAGLAMSPVTWRTFKTRDGLEIAAYLTKPAAAPAVGGRLPLIVLPHDGPHDRDVYEFDYMAQFLASRGYAVLQPQYRGSSGFGDDFLRASRGEWAGKIQTDLLDGIRALAQAGEIDPSKVCVVGIGFGGYSALAGAAFNGASYKCSVSIGGYAELGRVITEKIKLYAPETTAVSDAQQELGNPSVAQIAAASPSKHAADIQSPVLLIHGDQDTDVDISHSKSMAEALRAAGKPVEFITLEGENHYLTKSANRTRTLELIEQFLAKHLPVN